jgi:hypothetical protein
MITKINLTSQDKYWKAIRKDKDVHQKEIHAMSFEEKLSMVPILQAKARLMGHNITIWGEKTT